MMHRPLWAQRTLLRVLAAYAVTLPPALAMLTGIALGIEMTYRLTVKATEGAGMSFLTVPLAADSPLAWLSAGILVIGGFVLFRLTWPIVMSAWTSGESRKEQAQ